MPAPLDEVAALEVAAADDGSGGVALGAHVDKEQVVALLCKVAADSEAVLPAAAKSVGVDEPVA